MALGAYPDVSLADARARRDEARKLLAQGIDPSAQKKAARAASAERAPNSFEVIAREWMEKNITSWAETPPRHIKERLENNLLPWIGERPIAELRPANCSACKADSRSNPPNHLAVVEYP